MNNAMSQAPLHFESIKLPLKSGDQLAMTRFYRDKASLGPPVFMLHGLLEDSTAFYDANGLGFASYLAKQGYDVFMVDLRGKGHSWPLINATSQVGVHQHITEDIPTCLNKIQSLRPDDKIIWLGHGWGSVLLAAYLGRFGNEAIRPSSFIQVGSRRQLLNDNCFKRWFHYLMWQRLAKLVIALKGYLPSKFLGLGDVNESAAEVRDYLQWSENNAWLDPIDGFDYGGAIQSQQWPPSFYIAVSTDRYYADVADIRGFIKSLGRHDGRLVIIDKKSLLKRTYKHSQMLTHPDAESDYFSLITDWLDEYSS